MKERLKELRRALDLTQAEFANHLGLRQSTIATYEIGRNEPTQAVITSICREFDVNEEWLRTGEGEMFLPDLNDELKRLAHKYSLSKEEMALIEQFVKLSKPYREAVIAYVKNVGYAILGIKSETEVAEAAYQEALGFVLNEESSISNSTDDIQEQKEAK